MMNFTIEHKHPAAGKALHDELYDRNDALQSADDLVYAKRKDTRQNYSQFAFNAPPMWLSLCIGTVSARKFQFQRLAEEIYRQIVSDAPRKVEVLWDDREGISIGTKRQALLERAKGHFIAFIDDDDWISHDYVKRIIGAIEQNPEADCVSLVGQMTTAGQKCERFEHSLANQKWETRGGVYLRFPNHLNAIRREHALKVGFVPLDFGEDFDYSTRVKTLLKTEASTGTDPLYHYWFWPKELKKKKVISLALFGEARYWEGLPAYIRAHHALFPGWELRVHHDESIHNAPYGKTLQTLAKHNLVKLIEMPSRPSQGKCEKMLWRLAPAWDETVEYVFARDVDALPTWREREASEEFIQNGAELHTIHDNPMHVGIMGGLCGVKAVALRSRFASFEEFIAKSGYSDLRWEQKGADQDYLNSRILPHLKTFGHSLRVEYQNRDTAMGAIPYVTEIAKFDSNDVTKDLQDVSNTLIPYMGVAGFDIKKTISFYNGTGLPVMNAISECER